MRFLPPLLACCGWYLRFSLMIAESVPVHHLLVMHLLVPCLQLIPLNLFPTL